MPAFGIISVLDCEIGRPGGGYGLAYAGLNVYQWPLRRECKTAAASKGLRVANPGRCCPAIAVRALIIERIRVGIHNQEV